MPSDATQSRCAPPASPMPEIIGRLAAAADDLARSGTCDGRAQALRLRRRLEAIEHDGHPPPRFGEAAMLG